MSRVSENSGSASVEFALSKAKTKLEDLQMKGTSLKRMVKPSDDPSGNIELLQMKAQTKAIGQYQKNSNIAKTILEYTENAVKELTEIMNKVKEIAVGQSSDLFNKDTRLSISKEVEQLRKQVMGIGNRKLGNRYIFSGHKTETRPFNNKGEYQGDEGQTYLEISKEFYVPTNIPGNKVFFSLNEIKLTDDDPVKEVKENMPREQTFQGHTDGLLTQIDSLIDGLRTDNPDLIQGLLERLDSSVDRLVTLRTQVGAIINTIDNSDISLENFELYNAKRKSQLEDADIAELFSDMARQQNVLNAVYKTSAQLLDKTLIDFIR